ncbi:hypothetical protein D3C72_1492790 [compost metagenome]
MAARHRPLHQGNQDRRQGRAGCRARERARVADGDVDARQLPGFGVPVLQGLLRDARAQGSAAGRRGGGQPSPVLCRCGAARHRHGGTAAGRQHRDLRRSPPAARDRHAVLRRDAVHQPAAGNRPRYRGRRPVARARCGGLGCAGRAAGARRARPAPGLQQGQCAAGAGPDRGRPPYRRAFQRNARCAGRSPVRLRRDARKPGRACRIAAAMPPPRAGAGQQAGRVARRCRARAGTAADRGRRRSRAGAACRP